MSQNVSTQIKCSDCGKSATVPFKPSANKPVYCRECLSKHMTKRTDTRSSQGTGPENEKQAWSRRRNSWK